jgi:hypothetical protein
MGTWRSILLGSQNLSFFTLFDFVGDLPSIKCEQHLSSHTLALNGSAALPLAGNSSRTDACLSLSRPNQRPTTKTNERESMGLFRRDGRDETNLTTSFVLDDLWFVFCLLSLLLSLVKRFEAFLSDLSFNFERMSLDWSQSPDVVGLFLCLNLFDLFHSLEKSQ